MNFIEMFKQQPLVFIVLIVCVIVYFIFDQKVKYGNKKSAKELEKMTPEEYAEYKKKQKEIEITRSKKKRTNLTRRYSNIYDERHYESAPKDGTSIYQRGISTVSHKKKNKSSKALDRLVDYKHYLEVVKERNLNHLARNMELINYDCADDIYFLQKKGYFKDVRVDEVKCRIYYQGLSAEEDELNNIEPVSQDGVYEIVDETLGSMHVPGTNFAHNCPHCGTPNIIDTDTKEYNCYYCLDKVYVKGKNKK